MQLVVIVLSDTQAEAFFLLMQEDICLVEEKGAASNGKCQKNVILEHCNIIEPGFWNKHPNILGEKLDIL